MRTHDLWAARHPAVFARGICYGRADVALAVTAAHATSELRAAFPAAPRAVVWSSPSSRCAGVAKELATSWGAELRLDARLHEIDFGAWEGRAWSDIEREEPDGYATWMKNWRHAATPGGESLRALTARVSAWLDDARAAESVLIAHAGVVRALLVLLERASWTSAMSHDVAHLAWRRFALDDATPLDATCAPSPTLKTE